MIATLERILADHSPQLRSRLVAKMLILSWGDNLQSEGGVLRLPCRL